MLDDNAGLRGAKVHGVPVLGTLEQLPQRAHEVAAEMLLIAMPSGYGIYDGGRSTRAEQKILTSAHPPDILRSTTRP